eukprot:3059964-Rhodomonas_salina.2
MLQSNLEPCKPIGGHQRHVNFVCLDLLCVQEIIDHGIFRSERRACACPPFAAHNGVVDVHSTERACGCFIRPLRPRAPQLLKSSLERRPVYDLVKLSLIVESEGCFLCRNLVNQLRETHDAVVLF